MRDAAISRRVILTVTPERLEQVDFGEPFFRGVKEIAVTGPASPELASVDDLSGKEVFVRKSSSYWTHLEHLNERFAQEHKPPVTLKAAPEDLQDDDLLEMVNAGLVGIVVVDRYQALLWAKVFKKLKPHEGVVVNTGGDFAWMIRKDSPKLKAEIAAFANQYGQKSDFGKALVKQICRQSADRETGDIGRRDQEVRADGRVLSEVRQPSMTWTIC